MQKYFALYLLAFAFILHTGCTFNPSMQSRGAGYLQGEWQQDTAALPKKMVNYSLYNLKFSCDSFYVSIKTYSKVNPGADSCIKGNYYTEYAKGVYEHRNDTLHVRGLFCNANYTYKEPTGCFRSGVYEEYFKVKKQTDSTVQFNSTSSVVPVNARLIKKILVIQNHCNHENQHFQKDPFGRCPILLTAAKHGLGYQRPSYNRANCI